MRLPQSLRGFSFCLLFAGFCLPITGCHSSGTEVNGNRDSTRSEVLPGLAGTWSWAYSVGGLTGGEIFPKEPQDAYSLMISDAGTYQVLQNGNTGVMASSYTVERLAQGTDSVQVIHFKEQFRLRNEQLVPYPESIIHFRGNDTLQLENLGADVYLETYIRSR